MVSGALLANSSDPGFLAAPSAAEKRHSEILERIAGIYTEAKLFFIEIGILPRRIEGIDAQRRLAVIEIRIVEVNNVVLAARTDS